MILPRVEQSPNHETMNQTLVFLRQVFFPFPAADAKGGVSAYDVEVVGATNTEEVPTVLPPWVDTVARIIGFALTLAGTVSVAGIPLTEWISALLTGTCG